MTLEQVKSLMRYGDYAILGRMLSISAEAAKMRFLRGDALAFKGMKAIVEGRERLIENFLLKHNAS